MSIEHIRLSQQAKDQLVRLKRVTGISNWNVLCRWAFCISLAEPSIPAPAKIVSDSSVEMTWKVFGGEYNETYLALLKTRLHNDGFLPQSEETLHQQFKLHLHRGIGYLASKASNKQIENVADLLRLCQ